MAVSMPDSCIEAGQPRAEVLAMPTLADKAASLGIPVTSRGKKAPPKAASELKEGKATAHGRLVINLKASSFSSGSSATKVKVSMQGSSHLASCLRVVPPHQRLCASNVLSCS